MCADRHMYVCVYAFEGHRWTSNSILLELFFYETGLSLGPSIYRFSSSYLSLSSSGNQNHTAYPMHVSAGDQTWVFFCHLKQCINGGNYPASQSIKFTSNFPIGEIVCQDRQSERLHLSLWTVNDQTTWYLGWAWQCLAVPALVFQGKQVISDELGSKLGLEQSQN